jgi:hypothetical protein
MNALATGESPIPQPEELPQGRPRQCALAAHLDTPESLTHHSTPTIHNLKQEDSLLCHA